MGHLFKPSTELLWEAIIIHQAPKAFLWRISNSFSSSFGQFLDLFFFNHVYWCKCNDLFKDCSFTSLVTSWILFLLYTRSGWVLSFCNMINQWINLLVSSLEKSKTIQNKTKTKTKDPFWLKQKQGGNGPWRNKDVANMMEGRGMYGFPRKPKEPIEKLFAFQKGVIFLLSRPC